MEIKNEAGSILSWLLIILGFTILAATVFFGWGFWQKENRFTIFPGPKSSADLGTKINNITFYSTYSNSNFGYSDEKSDYPSGTACAAVMIDYSNKTIDVKYQNKFGKLKIIQGGSSNGGCIIVVQDGTFSEGGDLVLTGDWEEFENTACGYSIKYPSDWDYNYPKDTELKLNSPENKALLEKINRGEMYGEGYMDDILIECSKTTAENFQSILNDRSYLVIEPVEITLGYQKAYESVEGGFGAYYTIIAYKGDYMYKILFGNRESREKLTAIDKQILAFFNFTDSSVSTADWKMYTNSSLGISFKYPNKYTITETIGDKYSKDGGSGIMIVFNNTSKMFKGCAVSQDFSASRGGSLCEIKDFSYKNGKCNNDTLCSEIKTVDDSSVYFTETTSWETPVLAGFVPLSNNSIYKVFTFENLDTTDSAKNELKQILSTFQFTK